MMHMRSGALGRCFGVPWPQHRSFRSLATSSSPPAPARRLRRSSARGQSAPEAPPPTRRVQVSCCGCLCSVVGRGPAATGLCASTGCLLCAVLSGALWAPAGGCGRCRGGRRGAACSAGQPGADPGGHAAPGAHLRGCVRSTRHRARLCPAHRLPSAYGPAACQAGPGPCPRPGTLRCAHRQHRPAEQEGGCRGCEGEAEPPRRPCCCGRPGQLRRGRDRRRPAAGGGGGGRRQRGARRRARGGPAARHHSRAHPDGVPHSQPDVWRCARARGLSGDPGRAAARSAALLSGWAASAPDWAVPGSPGWAAWHGRPSRAALLRPGSTCRAGYIYKNSAAGARPAGAHNAQRALRGWRHDAGRALQGVRPTSARPHRIASFTLPLP